MSKTFDGCLAPDPSKAVVKAIFALCLVHFTGDLYGQHLSVALVDYLRPELKFDGLPGLLTQMARDVDRAREILAAV
jgi:FAD synthase